MSKAAKYILLSLLITGILNGFASNTDKLIEGANRAYNEGLYDSALSVYQKVYDSGLESGELYYNMGNAHYKNGDIANAILYYEKARKILPNDENIEYNLSIANSMIVDKIEKVPELFYDQWWQFMFNIVDADTGSVFLLIIFSLFVVSLGIFVLAKTRKNRKLTFYISLSLFVLTIVSGALTYQKYNRALINKEAIVFDPSVTVKSSPTQNAVDLFVIHEGTKVKIIDRIDNWSEIKIRNGSVGWLPETSIREI